MPSITIGQKKFNCETVAQKENLNQNLSAMINAILALPPIAIAPAQVNHLPMSEELILCFPSEAAYVDAARQLKYPRYIGAHSLSNGICVYAYNDLRHFIAHATGILEGDGTTLKKQDYLIQSGLSQFKNEGEVHIILLGGNSNAKIKISQKILNNILSNLISAAHTLQLDIHISGQKLLEHNRFTQADKNLFLLDKIKFRISRHYQWYFGEVLPDNAFSNSKEAKNNTDLEIINPLIEIVKISPLLINSENAKKLSDHFYNFQNKNIFLAALPYLLGPHGLALLDGVYSVYNLYPNVSLPHLMIDTQTQTIVPISSQIPLANGEIRKASSIDIYLQEPTMMRQIYWGNETCPDVTLSSEFTAKANAVAAKLSRPTQQICASNFRAELVANFGGFNDESYLETLTEAIRALAKPRQTVVQKTLTYCTSTQHRPKELDYKPSIINSIDDTIQPGHTTRPYLRAYPSFLVDGVIDCKSKDDAQTVQATLAKKGFKSELSEDSEKFQVIIPAINLSKKT